MLILRCQQEQKQLVLEREDFFSDISFQNLNIKQFCLNRLFAVESALISQILLSLLEPIYAIFAKQVSSHSGPRLSDILKSICWHAYPTCYLFVFLCYLLLCYDVL